MIGLAAVLPGTASAGIIPHFVSREQFGGEFTFYYTLDFVPSPGEQLQAGDFITFYDIRGFTSVLPYWTSFAWQLGIDAPGTAPPDDPDLHNITFTYDGDTVTTDTTFSNLMITHVTAPEMGVGWFGSRVTDSTGNAVSTVGLTTIPAVPEPALILPLALLALAWTMLYRIREHSHRAARPSG